jgi:hypothetical protein
MKTKTPSMTRQDFQFIAEILASASATARLGDRQTDYAKGNDDMMEIVVQTFAHRLAETNPQFDRDRFLVAAGQVLP